jgi:tetratricopeptide (TPR) repeat protein
MQRLGVGGGPALPWIALLWGVFALALPLFSAQNRPARTADFAALSTQANAARDNNQLDQAATLYKRALALRPQWTEGWWSLGAIQYDRNQYADAARAFQALVGGRFGRLYWPGLGLTGFALVGSASPAAVMPAAAAALLGLFLFKYAYIHAAQVVPQS